MQRLKEQKKILHKYQPNQIFVSELNIKKVAVTINTDLNDLKF